MAATIDKSTKRLVRLWAPVGIIILAFLCSIAVLVAVSIERDSDPTTFTVSGTSMEPTFVKGEKVTIRRTDSLKDGNLVVFSQPPGWSTTSSRKNIIKRVLAAPGDKITFNGTDFLVNGKVKYSLSPDYECSLESGYSHTLGSDELAVAGDNHKTSLDTIRNLCSGREPTAYVHVDTVVITGTVESTDKSENANKDNGSKNSESKESK